MTTSSRSLQTTGTGLRTLKTATAEMVRMGFTVDVAQAMLKAMKKENIVDIRGYSKQPPHLLKAIARAA
jgi:hypothetical protein